MAHRVKALVPDPADRARALALTPVSRETTERLDRFVALLLEWQRSTNLIAPSTIPQLWTRHIADSLQLLDIANAATSECEQPRGSAREHGHTWLDIGSGAGFPGLVIACALADIAGALVHLVESNAKKAAFLREAQRVTGAPAVVHAKRIEEVALTLTHIDIVTARAVAPLNVLLGQCFPLLGTNGAMALFPKGQNAELELAAAAKTWNMTATLVPSRTEPASRIVVIRGVARKAKTL
jgi:16S rRNA (guanine527-N7)-methyltransferase